MTDFSVPIEIISEALQRASPITVTEAEHYRAKLETILLWLKQQRSDATPGARKPHIPTPGCDGGW